MNRDDAIKKMEALINEVDGRLGVAAWPVGKPEQMVGVNADEQFPTASTFKVPVLYALYQMSERGEVDLTERIEITKDMLVPGSGVLQDLDFGLKPTIRDIAVLMTVVSDNEGTDILFDIVGPERIAKAMADLGLTKTEVPIDTKELLYGYVGLDANNPEHTYDESLRRMRADEYDFDGAAWQDTPGSGNDLSSPRDLAALCEAIELGRGINEESRFNIIDIMKRQKYNTVIPAGVPENVQVAHKTGSLKGVRADAAIVYGNADPYVIAVMSKRLKSEAEGIACLVKLSEICWELFGGDA